ncbi:MAG: hypothetical protein ACI8RH_001555 [Flavobacteriales bacterium]|jgi:hypothetical protein
MTTEDFFNTLNKHQDKSLLFQYMPGQLVGANYHITEVKHITVDAVDCGARTDAWKETIVQLWESPSEIGKTDFMSCGKALEILTTVGKMRPYTKTSEVRFEYSNALFHTAQLFVTSVEVHGSNLMLQLATQKTACKAEDICGIQEPTNTEVEANSCAPGGGCC